LKVPPGTSSMGQGGGLTTEKGMAKKRSGEGCRGCKLELFERNVALR